MINYRLSVCGILFFASLTLVSNEVRAQPVSKVPIDKQRNATLPQIVGNWAFSYSADRVTFALAIRSDSTGKLTANWLTTKGDVAIDSFEVDGNKLTLKSKKGDYVGRLTKADAMNGKLFTNGREYSVLSARMGKSLIGNWDIEVKTETNTNSQCLQVRRDLSGWFGSHPIAKLVLTPDVPQMIKKRPRTVEFAVVHTDKKRKFVGELRTGVLKGKLTDADGQMIASVIGTRASNSSDIERAVTELVVSIGGRVRATSGYIRQAQDIPQSSFQILAIRLASNQKVQDDDFAKLKDLRMLNNLFLANSSVGDGALEHIGEIKNLQSLYLPHTKVGDSGLRHLKSLPKLVNLYLDGTKVTDEGLKHLAELKGLKLLYLRHTNITDEGIQQLRTMSNLRYLYLGGTKVTSGGVSKLQAALPQLKIQQKDKFGNERDANRKEAIAAIQELGGDVRFDEHNGVVSVVLRGEEVNNSTLKQLQVLTELQAVQLYKTSVTEKGLRQLKGFRNLTRLGIVGPINDTGLSHVGDIVQLRSLYIPSARHVTDAGMKNLVRLKTLESLRLSRCQITGDGMQYLKQMTRLKTLDVYDTHVDDAGLRQLKGLKKLTFVVAKRTNVTKDGAKRLQQSLPNCEVAFSPRN